MENTATGFSSMMDCTFVFVADIVVGLGARLKKRRIREEMAAVGDADGMLERREFFPLNCGGQESAREDLQL